MYIRVSALFVLFAVTAKFVIIRLQFRILICVDNCDGNKTTEEASDE